MLPCEEHLIFTGPQNNSKQGREASTGGRGTRFCDSQNCLTHKISISILSSDKKQFSTQLMGSSNLSTSWHSDELCLHVLK